MSFNLADVVSIVSVRFEPRTLDQMESTLTYTPPRTIKSEGERYAQDTGMKFSPIKYHWNDNPTHRFAIADHTGSK
jgi:hypothetical protein